MTNAKAALETLTQDIALVKHFRDHIAAISDLENLDLLSLAATKPITNAQARAVFKSGRNGAWLRLSNLVRLGMLEKRGQFYRASPYASSLLYATSLTFRSVLNDIVPSVAPGVLPRLLEIAREGLEFLYARGKIEQHEYAERLRFLREVERHE